MERIRGFEVVVDKHRTAKDIFTDEKKRKHEFNRDIQLPVYADTGSAGADFFCPKDIQILPGHKTIIWTDVKAYMPENEVLKLYIRSSLAIKKGIMLSNQVGIIDSSYYSNESNDGNIGIALLNTSGQAVEIKAGERIAQGIFVSFNRADNASVLHETRVGGIGSSGV